MHGLPLVEVKLILKKTVRLRAFGGYRLLFIGATHIDEVAYLKSTGSSFNTMKPIKLKTVTVLFSPGRNKTLMQYLEVSFLPKGSTHVPFSS